MITQESRVGSFTEFFRENESRLRHALVAALGSDAGREATSEALALGWERWDAVSTMANPVGYLYRVGRDRGRKYLRRSAFRLPEVDQSLIPDVEPGLPEALAALSERQRSVVLLVHGHHWTLTEVAAVLGLSKTTVQNHAERGLAKLRRAIGDGG